MKTSCIKFVRLRIQLFCIRITENYGPREELNVDG